MDTAGKSLVLSHILALDTQISAMGSDASVCRLWGLSGAPLEVTLGSDNECFAYYRELGCKIGDNRSMSESVRLIEKTYKACAAHLCREPFIDSDALELNLRPGRAGEIIETHTFLERTIAPIAEQHKWNFAMGAGHWHLSVSDTGRTSQRSRHLMNSYAEDKPAYSNFAIDLANNLVAIQLLCPALFLRPSRSEKERVTYTDRVGLDREDNRYCTVQLNREAYSNGSLMFEMRMANLAPFAPVLMLLHAVQRTLQGETIRVEDYHFQNVYAKAPIAPGLGPLFVRGKGCYFDYLRQTGESGYLNRHMPDLKETLMRGCLDSYRTFLRTPTWSSMYSWDERQGALERLIRISHPKHVPQKPFSKPAQTGHGSLNLATAY